MLDFPQVFDATIRLAIAAAAGLILSLAAHGQSLSPAEQEVWDRELSYWEARKTGNLEAFMALWHDDFAGWPLRDASPIGKSNVLLFFESEKANTQPGSLTVALERLSVRVYGDTAVVFYRVRYSRLDKAGSRIETQGRFSHTFHRSGGVWLIVSGMSADEPRK
jgi:ketosteroid isomerase-like protein